MQEATKQVIINSIELKIHKVTLLNGHSCEIIFNELFRFLAN